MAVDSRVIIIVGTQRRAVNRGAGKTPRDGNQYFEYVVQTGQALNNANIALYPVDPRGMMSECLSRESPRLEPGNRPGSMGTAGSSNIPGLPTFGPCADYDHNGSTMAHLADMTGGKAFHDIASARQAIDHSSVTYTL